MGNDDIISGFDEETCDYLQVRLHKLEGVEHCLAVELVGSIDTYNSNFLRRSLMRVADAGFMQQVLVLPRLEYVSSTGVGTLLSMLRVLMEQGGGLSFVNPHRKVKEVFELMHLQTFFSCSDSIEAALEIVAGKIPGSAFPRKLNCPACGKALRAQKPGKFRCPECKTVLTVDGRGRACT